LGLAALESQACETPVVGVTEGGVPETIVDGETGVLTAREPERFGDAIGCMLEDSARRKVYGRAGRAWVGDRWNWERSTAELELALNDASGAHT
jgi:phosphatidylinositol alpha-1,6-mannosyltransferase